MVGGVGDGEELAGIGGGDVWRAQHEALAEVNQLDRTASSATAMGQVAVREVATDGRDFADERAEVQLGEVVGAVLETFKDVASDHGEGFLVVVPEVLVG